MSQDGKGGGEGGIQDRVYTQGGGHQTVQSAHAHDVVVSGKHRLLSTTLIMLLILQRE